MAISDNVTVAVVAACGVVISAVCVLGGAVFAYIGSSRATGKRFDGLDKGLDRIEHTLELIQTDMIKWSEQIFKIKSHIKLD